MAFIEPEQAMPPTMECTRCKRASFVLDTDARGWCPTCLLNEEQGDFETRFVKGRQEFARQAAGAVLGDVAKPPIEQRPIVHHGEVLGVLYGELTQLIREHQALKAFEARVVDAAKSPAAWLQLRQELAK
jgi:hypothetical protein